MIGKVLDECPENVLKACESFRQGFLIEKPPFFYVTDTNRPLWGPSRDIAAEADEDLEIVDLHPDDRPPYGLITTQTCDLHRPDQQPWFQVAPVYKCKGDDPILDGAFVLPLDSPDLRGSTWYVDLRIEMALEKGVLVDREPMQGFDDEQGFVRLAEVLARRRGRPALHNVFNDILTGVMRQMKEEDKGRRKQLRKLRKERSIYKLKLRIQDGDRLSPVAAVLYVIASGKPTPLAEDWFAEWWSRAREVAENAGLTLLPIEWRDARTLDVTEYDKLIEVRSNELELDK